VSPMPEAVTIAQAVHAAAEFLEKNGIKEGRRNADLLMMHLLEVEMADLVSRGSEELSTELQAQYVGLVNRRLNHEPLQYITKRAEFWSLDFYIDPRAPIPRPETEHIVEEVLKDHPNRNEKLKVVDVGTGSGILAVVLAHEFPKSTVYALDLEPGALEVAAINASRHNVSGRMKLLRGDLLAPVASEIGIDGADILVSNPPYISDKEAQGLEPEVIKAEPRRALVAGPSGLEIFRRLIPQAAVLLKPGGRLYLECGAKQAGHLEVIVSKESSLEHVRTVKDLQGIPRIIVGRKRE
jgi:release factor glutamine methyltransferase